MEKAKLVLKEEYYQFAKKHIQKDCEAIGYY